MIIFEKKITGYKVYELVTNDPTALHQVYKALPPAINDIMKKEDKPRFNLSKKRESNNGRL